MRIDALGLIRYGHFTDARLALPCPAQGADLHVVFGPNEAGKSTLFSAWLDFLFGFPAQTQYGFLHDYRALRIEAEITTATGPLHLARIKGRSNTLLDAQHDQPLPEATLSAALGGLDRASITTMFSLDDDTLEQGGESILSSEGELGQLLFSASAGLSDLSDALRSLQEDADQWFRAGARKLTLNEHKTRLRELDGARRAADVKASDWRKLCEAQAEAEARYMTARTHSAATRRRLGEIARDLDALRDLARLERREAVLDTLPPVEEFPASWLTDMPTWQREEAELDALGPVAETRRAALAQALDALGEDAKAEALSDRIDALERRFGAIAKDMEDLPKRQAAAADLDRQMTALLERLGRPDLTPEAARLPATLIAEFLALLEQDAVLRSKLELARSEHDRARDALPDGPARASLDEAALSRLGPLIKDLHRADLLRLDMNARAGLAQADNARRAAFAALAPWTGTPEALARLDLPSAAHLDALGHDLDSAAQRLRDVEADHLRLRGQLAQARAGLGAASELRAQDVADLRDDRDRAWAAHKSSLSASTAATFEQAMRADDRIRAQQIEAARQSERLTLIAQAQAALESTEAERVAAQAERTSQSAAVAALWAGIGVTPEGRSLADFVNWCARRDAAIAAANDHDRAAAELDAVQSRIGAAHAALAQTLGTLAALPRDPDFTTMLAEAEAQLEQAAALRLRAEREREAVVRETTLKAAQDARAQWQERWATVCAQCWIGTPAPEPEAMRAILDLVATLTERASRAAEFAQRIDSIERDIAAFTSELRGIARALDMPELGGPEQLWPQLRVHLQAALERKTERKRLRKAKAEAIDDCALIAARREALVARIAPVQARFGLRPLDALAQRLAAIAQAREVAQDCASLRDELAQKLDCADLAPERARLATLDIAALQIEQDALEARLTHEENAQQDAYVALAAAQKARDGVSQDAAAARLEAERQTLIMQIAEETRRFIARRAGIIAVEHALRRYRDTHRSSMMARASEAFAMLTGGRYSGLVTQAGGRDDVLMAQLANGATKAVATLSKGTRFQLYLALRAAGYHEFAASRATVPFIADDIFETFDDTRALAAFRLLGQMAQHGQVIYLTHHAHLCEIARAACPEVQIHDLQAE
ncbi:MAG: hypothetical protein EA339_03005 [Rhodobacteraceae bacterium]|nr:MAG: hypothetical protein EA339_03005 [Paracoccaceae bacterium]